MPWKAVGKKIIRSDTGEVVGESKDHATAVKAVKARYANTDEGKFQRNTGTRRGRRRKR